MHNSHVLNSKKNRILNIKKNTGQQNFLYNCQNDPKEKNIYLMPPKFIAVVGTIFVRVNELILIKLLHNHLIFF